MKTSPNQRWPEKKKPSSRGISSKEIYKAYDFTTKQKETILMPKKRKLKNGAIQVSGRSASSGRQIHTFVSANKAKNCC